MAEGYKSALIASLRGDAPQGPRMGSGVSPLMFDWMTGSNVPLSFQARRAALLNPERFELPLPLNPPMPSGGGRNDYEIPDTEMPPVDVPPSTERGQTVAEKPAAGEVVPPPPPPEPPPVVPEPTPEEPEGVITIEPVVPGEDIFADNPLPPPPAPAPAPVPPPEPEGVITIEPVEPGDDIFVDVPVPEPEPDLPPASEPEQDFEIVIEGPIEEPVIEEPNFVVPGPVDFQPPDPILEEFLRDWTEPVGEVTVEELDGTNVPGASNPLRDYGGDLGTTIIEGAFDPTLGGIFDPGLEVISPIAGPNDPFVNPYMGLSAQELNALLFGGP